MMKQLIETIHRLGPEDTTSLCDILEISGKRDLHTRIAEALTSHTGMNRVLSTLDPDEYRVLVHIYMNPKGVTYGELESRLKIPVTRIEEISLSLSRKMLCYVLKNRQRLHNKNDKMHHFPELKDFFSPADLGAALQQLGGVLEALFKNREPRDKKTARLTPSEKSAIDTVFSKGGIASIGEILEVVPEKNINELLSSLREKGIVSIIHDMEYPAFTGIILAPEILHSIIDRRRLNGGDSSVQVHNRYFLLLNILKIFDIISTFGLFLTKQKIFRKVDKSRIEDTLHEIYDIDGTPLPREHMLQLCLHIMNLLNLVKISGSSVVTTLNPVKNELQKPQSLLQRILFQLHEGTVENALFDSGLSIPSYHFLTFIIETLTRIGTCSFEYLKTVLSIKTMSEMENARYIKSVELKEKFSLSFQEAVRFLVLAGVLSIEKGLISLTDTGRKIAAKILKLVEQDNREQEMEQKCIYINPDFSLMIPKQEIPSEDLYHILTHTEIAKDDIILNTKISKASILRAFKRGMAQEPFLSSLRRFSRNDIPQNLTFMLQEWAQQTIRVNIMNAIIIHSNQPSFLEELSYGKLGHAIIERISPNYAIIDREHLDEVIKTAQDRDAVIRLFEEPE